MPELKLKREVMGCLIAARSGHGHFMDYHERFRHKEADKQCKCGQRRPRVRPFSCLTARSHRAKLFSKSKKKHLTLSETLGSSEGARLFEEWAPETNLYGRGENSGEAPEA